MSGGQDNTSIAVSNRISLEDLTPENLAILKRINSVVLPAKYSEKWYRESLEVGQLAKLACYDGVPVGAIRCVVDSEGSNSISSCARIYIMTLAVLAPYREFGIGTRLLEHIIETAKSLFLHEVYVHVWTENENALEWYQRRGFIRAELIEGYYHRMKPPADAWIMTKSF